MRTRFISWIGVLGILAILGQVIGCFPLRHDPDSDLHDGHYEEDDRR